MACWEREINEDGTDFAAVKPRGCTDLWCCGIFLIFWSILIFIASFSFVVGSPLRLVHGYDSFGNVCGKKNERMGELSYSGMDMSSRPYVFYLNMHNISQSMKICVQKCPNRTLYNEGDLVIFYQHSGSNLCRYDYELGKSDHRQVLGTPHASHLYAPHESSRAQSYTLRSEDEKRGAGPCPNFPVPETRPILNRCIPTYVTGLGEHIIASIYSYLNSFDTVQQVVTDLYSSWREMLIMLAVAVILSFLMVFTIHFLASIVSYIILIGVAITLTLLTTVLWWVYLDLKFNLQSIPNFAKLEEDQMNERAFLVLAIIMTIVTIILLLLALVMRKRVNLVVALFYESGACLRAMPMLLIQPVWTFLFLVGFYAVWVSVLLALATADYPNRNRVELHSRAKTPFVSDIDKSVTYGQADITAFTWIAYNSPSWVRYMWWYMLIAFFWTSEFIIGCEQMVIAGSVASWYFCRNRENLWCPIGRSIRRLVLYHMGSVVLGSFLIAAFKIPRVIIKYTQSYLKKYQNNVAVDSCLRCCACFTWCMEKFMKYLNHNAYTIVAIEGEDFCTSAQISFQSLVSNALRVATINSVGDFILFLGKVAVTAMTATVGVILMKYNDQLHFYAVPVVVISILAYFIAHSVLSVYEMVIDTLFLCFCQDFNRHDGTPGNEFYAPPSLIKFITGEETDASLRQLKQSQNEEREDSPHYY